MSYKFYDVARLHSRDYVFASRYWRHKFLRRLQGNSPKFLVFCNSYPKSGTHLLYQILYSIPGLKRWDDIVSVQALCGIMNTASHIRWKIGSAPSKSIVRSHLMHCDEILEILEEFNCKILFIYRDLRDVAVSHARWVTKEERIFLHPLYTKMSNFDEQLMSSIKGVPLGMPLGSNISQPDIGTDFSRWKGWVSDCKTLSVRFEDLVGERGGGSEDKRLCAVEQILDYLEISFPSHQIGSKFASYVLSPQESHTFQKGGKGGIGSWKTIFNQSHKEAFKKSAGNLLIELGYEQNLSW